MTSKIKIVGNAPELREYIPPMHQEAQFFALFNSPDAMADYVATHQTWWDDSAAAALQRHLSAGLDMVRHGWSEGASRAAGIRDRIAVSRPLARQLARYDIAGAIPSVPRAVAGNPMHMKRIDYAGARRRPVVTLLNHMGGTSSVSNEAFVNKAGVVAAIVDAIENEGYSVHLIGLSQSSSLSDKQLVTTACTVKEPGQPVDLTRAAFSVGHVAMYRGLVFATRLGDKFNKPLGGGLGVTKDFTERLPGVYVLPSMNTTAEFFTSERMAENQGVDVLTRSLADQGCPAFRTHPNFRERAA